MGTRRQHGAQDIKTMTVMVCGFRLLGMIMKTRCLEKKMRQRVDALETPPCCE